MANGKFRDFASDMLNHFFRATYSNSPAACKVSLHASGTTSTALGTEISGTGYTAGGSDPGFAAPVTSGDPVTMTSGNTLQWTNGSGGNWSVDSLVIHNGGAATIDDINADACRLYINGLGLTVPNGSTITITAGDLDISEATN